MAPQESAMTPEAAAAAIADVKEVRQGLTARAAGIIWMVWGLVLAGLSITDVASWAGGGGQGFGLTEVLDLVYIMALAGTGVGATVGIWKAQAIVTGRGARFWLVTLLVMAAIVVGAVASTFIITTLIDTVTPGRPQAFYKTSFPLFAAVVAGTIAWLQRRHVAWWPGTAVVVVLIMMQGALPYLVGEAETLTTAVRASFLLGAVITLSYAGVGFWHFLRG